MATRYVVLKREIGQHDDIARGEAGESWTVVGEPVDATTDIAAIKAVANKTGTDISNGAVAVPARSWRPRNPERKVQEVTLWR